MIALRRVEPGGPPLAARRVRTEDEDRSAQLQLQIPLDDSLRERLGL